MFSRFGCLFAILVLCQGGFTYEEQGEYDGALNYGSNFDDIYTGITSLVSSPVAAAVHNVDNGHHPQLFDTVASSSIDSIQSRLTPRDITFAPESFGFNPIASQSFFPVGKSAKLTVQQQQQQQQQQQLQPHIAPVAQQIRPLRYDIRTVHDANYKVYKPEEEETEDILAKLKKNPSVASYFQPGVTEVEVAHPFDYRKEDLVDIREDQNNYKSNPYIAGPARIRRYAGGRSRGKQRKNSEEDDGGYDYKAEYISRPKAFDSSPYSSYKEDPNKQYEYPYKYDSGYDHKEYERIKQLSEKQAAEIKENPGNCQEVKKDGMVCTTCKDPKTGGNYESCSYVAEPKNNKYAYSKERKFDSNDEPDAPETNQKSESPKQSEKYHAEKNEESAPQRYAEEKPYGNYKREDNGDNAEDKYKTYYGHSSKPKTSESLRAAASDEGSSEKTESVVQPYDYQKALPGFYTNNEPKKDVEHVLAEFKKKDRSACKKVQKNGMTCYQCIDDAGLKNEECMFVSESAPRQSHLAYQEVKAFTSKPATIETGNEGAESQTITTSAPAATAAASFVVENPEYGKKLKRKKTSSSTVATSATNPIPTIQQPQKVKRSVESDTEINAWISDESNIAPPEEFAGAESRGAYWAETMPRYSPVLGVTLPEYMLSRSEHEVSFDETVAGA